MLDELAGFTAPESWWGQIRLWSRTEAMPWLLSGT